MSLFRLDDVLNNQSCQHKTENGGSVRNGSVGMHFGCMPIVFGQSFGGFVEGGCTQTFLPNSTPGIS